MGLKTRFATVIALAVAMPFGGALAEADPALVGAWTGTAIQTYPDGTADEFPADIVFLPDGTGTTGYPTYSCSGTLAPIAGEGPGVFVETITVGIENCATNGVFTFTVETDGLHFEWTHVKFGTASGVLHRAGGK